MFNRVLTVFHKKRDCRNNWQAQPRDDCGHFLSYDGRSPKAERAAREKVRAHVRAQGKAAMKRLEADLIAHVVRLLVESPPEVQRGITAWDASRKGYI
jgi:plasmid stabilization system protein ParE